jgi:hypothetical protein
MNTPRTSAPYAPLLFLLSITACGNLTAGGFGEATVSVTGDHEPAAPSPSMSVAEAAASAPTLLPGQSDDEPEGEIEIEFEVFLVNELGRRVQVGNDDLRVRVDLQGVRRLEATREQVPAVRYTELVVVFTDIEVEVEGGLVIDGVPIVGAVEVEFDDVSIEVVRAIDVDVQPNQVVDLVLDLNAPAWLAAVNPLTFSVDEAVFAALVNVVVS